MRFGCRESHNAPTGENEPLEGLAPGNRDWIAEVGRRCPEQKIATGDQDSTILESHQREALRLLPLPP